MVTRQWKAVVSIGGTVAASLPSSARRATQELDKLTTAQRIDAKEGKRLGAEIKSLTKGSQSYKTALAQQAAIKERTAKRSVKIRELGERTQKTGGILSRFSGGLAGLGPAGAAASAGIGLAAGAVGGLFALMNKAAGQARGLTRGAVLFDTDTEQIERISAAFTTVTGDAKKGREQTMELLSVGQRTRQAQKGLVAGFGEIGLGASRAGVKIASITSENYRDVVDDLRRSLEHGISTDQVVAGLRQIGYSDEASATLLQLATDTDAAQRALENFHAVEPLTEEQLQELQEWDDTWNDLKRTFNELWRTAVTTAAPALTLVADALTDLLDGTEGVFGLLVSGLDLVAKAADRAYYAIVDLFSVSGGGLSEEERNAAYLEASRTIHTMTYSPYSPGAGSVPPERPSPALQAGYADLRQANQRLDAGRPEAAQAAVQPEAALRSADVLAAPAQAAVQPAPSTVQQNNTFYIEGATDTDSVLAGVELALTRTVRDLA